MYCQYMYTFLNGVLVQWKFYSVKIYLLHLNLLNIKVSYISLNQIFWQDFNPTIGLHW